jgi:hypothetical protein
MAKSWSCVMPKTTALKKSNKSNLKSLAKIYN